MGLFSRIFSSAASQAEFKCAPETKTIIIDAVGILDISLKNGATPTPRDNFELLKSLAQWTAKEALTLTVIFTGRPLREAVEGATYKGIKVYYAENAAASRKVATRLAQSADNWRKALIVTADPELERMAMAQGADCIRAATFKKTLDSSREGYDGRETRKSARAAQRANINNAKKNRKNVDAAPDADESETPVADKQPKPAAQNNANNASKEILDLIDPI